MTYIKNGLEGLGIFVKSHFLGRYGIVVLRQQWEDMIQEVSVFYGFFQNTLIFAVDKFLHLRGMTTYLGISEIWSIQLLLFDFAIMQW